MKIDHDGVKLNVHDTEHGNTALVFLHYWGGSSRTWSQVISMLKARTRCVAIDARGAGDSDAPESGYSTEDHASDAERVVQALGLERYFLVGHSMGGKAAQVLAARQPRGLQGLALVASSPPSPMLIDDAQREQMKKAYADRAAVEWSLDNVLLGSEVPIEVRELLIADSLRLSLPATSGWIDVGTREDFSQKMSKVSVPVLVVAGALDRVDPIPVVEKHLLPSHPSANYQLLPNKGHLLPVEAPHELAAILAGFCGTMT